MKTDGKKISNESGSQSPNLKVLGSGGVESDPDPEIPRPPGTPEVEITRNRIL